MDQQFFVPESPSGIRLGDKIRSTRPEKEDATGRVAIMVHHASGAWHHWITKIGKDAVSEINDARCSLVEATDKPDETLVPTFQMKQMVRHCLSGIQGQIRTIEYHDSGCIRYHVATGELTDLGTFVSFTCDPDEIEAMEVVAQEPTKVPAQVEEPLVVTAGAKKEKRPSPNFSERIPELLRE